MVLHGTLQHLTRRVADELVKVLECTQDPKRVARATEALLDCDVADDFVKRVREG